MNRNVAIVLVVFAVGYFSALIVTNFSEINFPETDSQYVVELKDGVSLSDNVETDDVKHPLVGTIKTSADGSTCWLVTDMSGAFYYKILEECPDNV